MPFVSTSLAKVHAHECQLASAAAVTTLPGLASTAELLTFSLGSYEGVLSTPTRNTVRGCIMSSREIPQNETLFRNRNFTEVIKVK